MCVCVCVCVCVRAYVIYWLFFVCYCSANVVYTKEIHNVSVITRDTQGRILFELKWERGGGGGGVIPRLTIHTISVSKYNSGTLPAQLQ